MITDLLAWTLSHPVVAGLIITAIFVVVAGDAALIARLLGSGRDRALRIGGARR